MSHRDLKSVHDKPFIQKIVIKHIPDEYPNLEHLEQEYEDVPEPERSKYLAQDKKRLDAYNNGYWYSMGIRAETEILVPEHLLGYSSNNPSYRIVPITSGGIWGVESDYIDEYKDDENTEIQNLKDLLKVFGIEVPTDIPIVRED